MKKFVLASLLGVLSLTFLSLVDGGTAMATEEPKYEVLEQRGPVELRLYQPMLIAETWVTGSMNEASNRGFRVLADFIFGNNTAESGRSQDIAMTSPVTMKPQSVEISMTAPVTMQQNDNRWRVHFVMPSKYSYETLPKPNNSQVQVRQVPTQTYAVVSFSGFAGERRTKQIATELLAWMQDQGLTPLGSPEVARYDPPWRLPFLRRNEIMIAYLDDQHDDEVAVVVK
ncbi:MAG: heme-binding protein [Aliidiomarina sp.]|uniref:SOUL family heme-binding protein n=1 Tax=Aliidiomarina sp. TaxID=1872439 RepID=UPI0025B90FFA|nr:heme-binding protein [Aliidiomarina sp.]MCH8500556.1 heme-binding protein [Aliidiomarina sp.]